MAFLQLVGQICVNGSDLKQDRAAEDDSMTVIPSGDKHASSVNPVGVFHLSSGDLVTAKAQSVGGTFAHCKGSLVVIQLSKDA